MRLRLVFLSFMLVLAVGLIDGAYPPPCNIANHGVQIAGMCYDCGEIDNVCPGDYGADCGSTRDEDCKTVYWADTDEIEITSADMSYTSFSDTLNEITVLLIAERTRLVENTELEFLIYESDPVSDDDILVGNEALTASVDQFGKTSVSWTINKTYLERAYTQFADQESGIVDDFEFYFEVYEVGVPVLLYTSNTLIVNVQESNCGLVNFCLDYADENSCNNDACSVAESSPQCDPATEICGCSWDTSQNECSYSETPIGSAFCGNGIIEAGETCDGSNLGNNPPICSDFNPSWSGSPACNSQCHFDTSGCSGATPGLCGDGTLNSNEECDGSVSGFICSDFDEFTGGSIDCGSNCLLDTSSCTGGTSQGFSVGTCLYNEDTTDDCSDGLLSYSYDATWEWGSNTYTDPTNNGPSGDIGDYIEDPVGSGFWHYDPTGKSTECSGSGESTFECPDKIQLSFFGIYSFIAAVILIALIYVLFFLRRKKK